MTRRLFYKYSKVRDLNSIPCRFVLLIELLLLLAAGCCHCHVMMPEQQQQQQQYNANNNNNKARRSRNHHHHGLDKQKTSSISFFPSIEAFTTTPTSALTMTTPYGHERNTHISSSSRSAAAGRPPYLNSNSVWQRGSSAPFLKSSSSLSSFSTLLLAHAVLSSSSSSPPLSPPPPPLPSAATTTIATTTSWEKKLEKLETTNNDDETTKRRRREWLLREIAKRREHNVNLHHDDVRQMVKAKNDATTADATTTTLTPTTTSSTSTSSSSVSRSSSSSPDAAVVVDKNYRRKDGILDLDALFAEVDKRDGLDIWGLEHERKTLTLPGPWACRDEQEETHLAAMKLLLEADLQRFDEIMSMKMAASSSGSSSYTGTSSIQLLRQAFPDVYGDFRLLRFLRKDKDQDPVSASVQYRKFLKWRMDEGIDAIRAAVEQDQHRRRPFVYPTQPLSSSSSRSGRVVNVDHHHHNFDILARLLPCDFHPVVHQQFLEEATMDKTTNSNSSNSSVDMIPIILYMGDWDIAELTRLVRQKELSIRDILHYWIYLLESLHRELYVQSLQHERMMYVDEICLLSSSSSTLQQQQQQQQKTVSSRSPSCLLSMYFYKKIVRPVLSMTQAFYPETAQRIRLVHPTRFISFVWNTMIKSLIKPGTRAKVEIIDQQIINDS